MEFLTGKEAAERISGILHAKYQVHGYAVHLTARKISAIDPNGQIDFGGSEYVAAGRVEIAPHRLRPEDSYQWWDLERGGYFVECNETLSLADDEIVLLEPDDRLLRAGGYHVPQFVRGHVAPIQILLEVSAPRLRVKENARFSHARLFRFVGEKKASRASRATKPAKSKRSPKKRNTSRG